MLLPRLNCFMCVSGSASTSPGRPTGPGADVPPDAVENWSRVPSRTVPARAPRVRRAPAWRLADRSGSGYWVCASRGLCVQRRSRPAGHAAGILGYLRPPYSYGLPASTRVLTSYRLTSPRIDVSHPLLALA